MRTRAFFATVALACTPSAARAYPTAAVFSPTGEAKPGGTVGVLAYASTNLSPAISPGATWFGVEVGLLPQWGYGKGVKFGGLEIGFDTISPYGDGVVKPVLNAKLGLVTEGAYSPAVGAGIMQISPALPSMNFLYVAATKTLDFGDDGPSFGRLTLGFGANAGSRAQFSATFPFDDTRLALMVAYESPLVAKRLGLVVDHLGGASEISSTYVGLTALVAEQTTISAGAYIANERSNPATTYDGVFGYVTTAFDVLKLFSE